jgi:uncharacterized protein
MDKQNKGQSDNLSRRDFIRIGAAGAAILGAGGMAGCSSQPSGGSAALVCPKKKLGKTNMIASTVALGGGSALSMVKDDQEAVALIQYAFSKGINYFDSGADYDGGRSQRRIGEAMEPHRKEVYLSTKYLPNTPPDQLKQKVEETLKSYRTDYVDVANMHGLGKMDDVETMFTSGALETLVKLKEQGVVRHIGVTSHNHPPALAEALKRFNFDTSLHAANASKVPFVGEFEELPTTSFEELSIPLANSQGIGVWAFKITGQRRLIQKTSEAGKAPGDVLLRYGFSLPVHGIVLGMHAKEHIDSAVDMANNFKPMTADEMRSWNEKLAPSANELTLFYLRDGYRDDGAPRAHLA